jgi:hypothetical protein
MWDEIVADLGYCARAFYLIGPRNLPAEGYVSEGVHSRVCKYPAECGADNCYFETTFCCTDHAAGGIDTCKAYHEILPARGSMTVNLDQRTCTLP